MQRKDPMMKAPNATNRNFDLNGGSNNFENANAALITNSMVGASQIMTNGKTAEDAQFDMNGNEFMKKSLEVMHEHMGLIEDKIASIKKVIDG